jgi:hypothetical protein
MSKKIYYYNIKLNFLCLFDHYFLHDLSVGKKGVILTYKSGVFIS